MELKTVKCCENCRNFVCNPGGWHVHVDYCSYHEISCESTNYCDNYEKDLTMF